MRTFLSRCQCQRAVGSRDQPSSIITDPSNHTSIHLQTNAREQQRTSRTKTQIANMVQDPRTRVCCCIQIALRLAAMAIGAATLAVLIQLSLKWRSETFPVPAAAICLSLVIDSIQILTLLKSMIRNMKMHRYEAPVIILLEFLVIALGFGGIVEMVLNHYNDDDEVATVVTYPWAKMEGVCYCLLVAVIAWRIIFFVWACVDCCLVVRHVREARHDAEARGALPALPMTMTRLWR